LTLTNSTVSDNRSASHGGGIFNDSSGILTLINSTVSRNGSSGHNSASGGGIANLGTLTLTNSTVSDNAALGGGGGIFNGISGILTLTNSTVSGNGAIVQVGGITNFGTANLFNATITNNSVGFGSGGVSGGGTFNFQNTILAGNFRSGAGMRISSDCAGTINSNGNNLMGSLLDCTVNGAGVTVANPNLGPLQNNGGPTQTHALRSSSPAIDASDPGGCRDSQGALLQTTSGALPAMSTATTTAQRDVTSAPSRASAHRQLSSTLTATA
jgi:hypothetical protein